MALERFLLEVLPQPFTEDGTNLGKIALSEPWLFKVGQRVVIISDTQPGRELQVQRVDEDALFVGPLGSCETNPKARENVSAFLVADNANISAPEQKKPFVADNQNYGTDELEHEEEPTNAKRVILVDQMGRPLPPNPLNEVIIDFDTGGDHVIVAGEAGSKIRVYRLFFVVSSGTDIIVKDGAGTNLTGTLSMTAHGAVVLDFTVENQAWFTTGDGNDFIINQSGTAQVSGRLYYKSGP